MGGTLKVSKARGIKKYMGGEWTFFEVASKNYCRVLKYFWIWLHVDHKAATVKQEKIKCTSLKFSCAAAYQSL